MDATKKYCFFTPRGLPVLFVLTLTSYDETILPVFSCAMLCSDLIH